MVKFIEDNACSLSTYFDDIKDNTDESLIVEQDGLEEEQIGAIGEFLHSMISVPEFKEIISKIYLGAIYTNYLNYEIKESSTYSLELLLDTSFLLGLMKLQSPEQNDACNHILKICRKLEFKLSVLGITIEETKRLLDIKAKTFYYDYADRELNPQSILAACDRRKWTPTDLHALSSSLSNRLARDYKINLIQEDGYYRELAVSEKYSNLYSKMLEIRSSQFSEVVWFGRTRI